MTDDLERRLREALPLLDGLETGQDCEEYAYAHGNGFQAMTHCPSAFEALRSLPEAIGELTRLRAENEALEWLGAQPRLSLEFYSPVYGDDDDQSREWRVHRVSGGINDREWEVVGRGETPGAALISARQALQEGSRHE